MEKLGQKGYLLNENQKLLGKALLRVGGWKEGNMENDDLSMPILENVSKSLNGADIILYSGDIDPGGSDRVVDITCNSTNDNVLFMLCTPGGEVHSAYKIARRLQKQYKKFYLYVYGYCKSAGTLIAIGSDELIMSDYGEFGPLDVQLQEKDEIWRFSSGLNIDESIRTLRGETLGFFRHTLMDLVTGAGISTKTAAKLATKLSIGFIDPIVSQIDPVRIGETQRAVKIALAYGERLFKPRGRGNLSSSKQLVRLVSDYPDHGFVIDFEEAKEIFKSVRKRTKEEEKLCNIGVFKDNIRYPKTEQVINKYYPVESENEQVHQSGDTEGTG